MGLLSPSSLLNKSCLQLPPHPPNSSLPLYRTVTTDNQERPGAGRWGTAPLSESRKGPKRRSTLVPGCAELSAPIPTHYGCDLGTSVSRLSLRVPGEPSPPQCWIYEVIALCPHGFFFPVTLCLPPAEDLLELCRRREGRGSARSESSQSRLRHTWTRLYKLPPRNLMAGQREGVPGDSWVGGSEVKL